MKQTQEEKQQVGLSGEFRVLSELLAKGINATITFGNAKATDILIFKNDKRYLRIEVKTCKNRRNFVTSFFPKYTEMKISDPDFWVLFLPSYNIEGKRDTYYILSHEEVRQVQLKVNNGNETKQGQGVDNIPIKFLEMIPDCIDNWIKIISIP